jgi:hypothetical protein
MYNIATLQRRIAAIKFHDIIDSTKNTANGLQCGMYCGVSPKTSYY